MVRPLITAHSGCLGTAPNSPDSLEASLASGVDFLEVDIRLDPAGGLVLSHDPVLPGMVTPLDLETAWARVAGTGVGFNFDVKEREALGPLALFLESVSGFDEVPLVVTGCDGCSAARWVSMATRVPVLYNVERGPRPGEVRAHWEDRVITEARASGASGLNADHRVVTAGLAVLARRALLPLFVWTVNDDRALVRMAEWGVTGVTTDHPRRAHRILTRF